MTASKLNLLLLVIAVTSWAGDPQLTNGANAGRTYYVAPDGSDTAEGSEASPFKTIPRAAKAAEPGTTIVVAPGIYEGGVKTTASGTAEARIRFVSKTKGGAKLVPPADSKNDTAWDNRGSFVEIDGFEVDGSTSQKGTKWTHGIYFGGSYGVIRNNHVHHIATEVPCTSAGGSGIGVDSYYHGVHIEVVGNIVHDIGPPGCRFVQGIYVSTSGAVRNNVVYRVSEAAIHLWHDANSVVISHNTVAASHTGIIVGGGDFYHRTGPNDDTHVFNNIVYDCAYGISEQGRTGLHNSYHHNLVHGSASAAWSLKNGLKATETVDAPPRFRSYTRTGTPDFRLDPASPAIRRGTATEAPEVDAAGRPREKSTGFDLGAYQH
jgi:hypothetical protein